MDHILQLHVEHHHHYCSLKHSDSGVARFRKTVDDASQQVIVLAFAAMASSLALLFLPSFSMGRPLSPWLLAVGSCLLSTKTALFVLSNAIFALLAADCRWFFATGSAFASGDGGGGVSACEPGDVLEKQGRHGHEDLQRHAVLSCVRDKNSITSSEAFTEPVIVSDSTTTLEALEQQEEEDAPVTTGPEFPGLLDERDSSVALELETDAVEEPTCETASGLDELEIYELNKKFDEFIQSRKNKWIKEETLLAVAVAPCLTC